VLEILMYFSTLRFLRSGETRPAFARYGFFTSSETDVADMDQLLYWHWWVAGFALLVAEMFLPTGFVLLWIGISAIVVGALTWALPLSWSAQLALFSVLALLSFFLWKRFRGAPPASDRPTLNRRGHSYIGRNFTLTDPIVNGIGKLRVDDSQWRISGPDAPAGTQVRVIEADGSTLHVEKAS